MAEIKASYSTKRVSLREAVPLPAPLSMYVEATRACNLKCFYCMHSTRGDKNGELAKTGFDIKHMDAKLWEKLTGEIMSFSPVPKRVTFSGLGEPLMNPKLPQMVKMLRGAGFNGRIDVITNGVLLTPQTSDALIEAGISRIQISVQSMYADRYKEIAGVYVDVEQYAENIRYLYEHKGSAKIFIKIIDANLKNETEEKEFFRVFTPICDTIFIEHLVVMETQMEKLKETVDERRNLNNEVYEPRLCCGVMFYFLQVGADGDTFPCSVPGLPISFSMGSMEEQTLQEIWNGSVRLSRLRKNLKDGYRSMPVCEDCGSCVNVIQGKEENVDDCRLELLERLGGTAND
jgi:MoaA/NifB/PqqE/SkfB family radical SAM enzyme